MKRKSDSFDYSELKCHLKGELARNILTAIAGGDEIPATLLLPILPKALKPLVRIFCRKYGARRSENFIKSLSYLRKNRLVSISEKDGNAVLTLSENGKKRLLNFNLDRITIKTPKRWDGLWRVVIFDIPEHKKIGREALRGKLKQLGFQQLQKSCFVHPFDCKAEVDYISEVFEVAPFVNFIVAKEIEGALQLKKIFGLL